MDIISHGLWGSVAFGRKNRRSFCLAFLFGVLPDLLAFAPFTVARLLGFYRTEINWGEPPDPTVFPSYIYGVYDVSHSLIIFVAVFIALWVIFRRPIWELSAWGLHILVDIPTHSARFFPTPFLWPLSDAQVNGHSWGDPTIFIPNVVLLLTLYSWFFWIKPRYSDKKPIE